MNFNNQKIKLEFSNPDVKRNIKLPKDMNEELAELIGIFVGDGHIAIRKNINSKRKYTHYEIRLAGHAIDDYYYHNLYVNRLFKKLFNINLNLKINESKNELKHSIDSKLIIEFFGKIIKLPIGNKENISIPQVILNSNKNIKCAFLRGLADTDFSLTFKKKTYKNNCYPVIRCKFKSKNLIEDLKLILKELDFNYSYCFEKNYDKRINKYDYGHSIYISGKKNLEKWIKEIGFSNLKHLTKYQIWKRSGFVQPYTNINQRMEILNGPEGI